MTKMSNISCLTIIVSYNVLQLLLIDTHPFTKMFIKHFGDNMTARDNTCMPLWDTELIYAKRVSRIACTLNRVIAFEEVFRQIVIFRERAIGERRNNFSLRKSIENDDGRDRLFDWQSISLARPLTSILFMPDLKMTRAKKIPEWLALSFAQARVISGRNFIFVHCRWRWRLNRSLATDSGLTD